MRRETYSEFDATELYCPNCKRAVPVRKRLLLILPDGDKYDYTCTCCGRSLGDKMVTQRDNLRVIIK